MQTVELGRFDRLVDRAPIDGILGAGLVDDVFVARRAPGVAAGIRDKTAAQPDIAFAAPHRMFVKKWRRQVPVYGVKVRHPLFDEAEAGSTRKQAFVRLIQAFLH